MSEIFMDNLLKLYWKTFKKQNLISYKPWSLMRLNTDVMKRKRSEKNRPTYTLTWFMVLKINGKR